MKEPTQATKDASTLHKWLIAYSLDSGGKFPDNLPQLMTRNYGADEKLFPNVIEYRGRGVSNGDNPDLVLLRYRRDGCESIVTVGGSARSVSASVHP
jgi:hypothetical protein